MHSRRPVGLSSIIVRSLLQTKIGVQNELIKRKAFVTKDQILSGTHYKQADSKSFTSKIKSALYANTVGWFFSPTPVIDQGEDESDDSQLIVSVDYLKKKADSLLHWANSINKDIFSEKKLRKYLTQLKLSSIDIDMLFAHLQHSDMMASETLTISGQPVTLFKLGNLGSGGVPEITEKEKAKFVLEQNAALLEDQITKTINRVQKLNNDIKEMLRMGSKKNALLLLSQKKKLEAFWERMQGQKYQVEE